MARKQAANDERSKRNLVVLHVGPGHVRRVEDRRRDRHPVSRAVGFSLCWLTICAAFLLRDVEL
jgi:hypothetical protein